jgi:hypothetical protein
LIALGCATSPAPAVVEVPGEAARVESVLAAVQEREDPPKPDPLATARGILAELAPKGTYLSEDVIAELVEAGLSMPVVVGALEQLAADCEDTRTPVCGHLEADALVREQLAEIVAARGDVSASPVLMRLDRFGDYQAGHALDEILERRMVASLKPCDAPSRDEIAAARADVEGFLVIDAVDGVLVGRAATPAELDDLAYFLAAVAQAGPSVGSDPGTTRSGVDPTPAEILDRTAWLASVEYGHRVGDPERVLQAGETYLRSLGWPDKIDVSREVDVAWGGARFSYVMRDVARAAELVGDPQLAAALYRRANPGGGACGTSVDYRRGEQILGLIRAAEAAGSCRAVVPERLMNWEGRASSAYGPARLRRSGFDLARLYRGALLTRHRDRDATMVEAALRRAPADLVEPALQRLRERGPEAWEHRIAAIEGIPAEQGRAGVEQLLPQLAVLDDTGRARAIRAIGDAGVRMFVGRCPEGSWGFGSAHGNVWRRSVPAFGKSCDSSYSDGDAERIHRILAPFALATDHELREQTIGAIENLAPRDGRRTLRRAAAKTVRELTRCRAEHKDDDDEHACSSIASLAEAIDRSIAHLNELEAEALR